ncbi:MAG: hypothetical protein V4629_11045 [Pseudomonadota bacterium]
MSNNENTYSYFTKIGLQAAKRAARKVIEQAHKDNKPMPIWDGEKVIYQIPPIPQDSD